MALIDCKECGHNVSTEAAACPNCGAPSKQPHGVVPTPRVQVGRGQQGAVDKAVTGAALLVFRLLVMLFVASFVLGIFSEDLDSDWDPKVPFIGLDEFDVAALFGLWLGCAVFLFPAVVGLLMLKNWGAQLFLLIHVVLGIALVKMFGFHEAFLDSTLPQVHLVIIVLIVFISQISHRSHFK